MLDDVVSVLKIKTILKNIKKTQEITSMFDKELAIRNLKMSNHKKC